MTIQNTKTKPKNTKGVTTVCTLSIPPKRAKKIRSISGKTVERGCIDLIRVALLLADIHPTLFYKLSKAI